MLYKVAAALSVLVVLLLLLAGYLSILASSLPDLRTDPNSYRVAETSILYAADGTVLAEWYDDQDRTVVSQDVIPAWLNEAVVAIEDKRFYDHGGVDPQAIARALSINAVAGEIRQGGSTITQQTVKLLYTDGKRTYARKLQEALLALSLETRADKADVLGVYINAVYFGRGAYGVESAAQRFFGVKTQELTLAQCALLAGCIRSPTRYDPFINPGTALERRNVVLREMRDQGYITIKQGMLASAEPLGLKHIAAPPKHFAPYFVEYVRRELLERLGSERLYRGGLRIRTTLEPGVQRAAEAAARAALPRTSDPEVAVAAVRWSDGGVLAIVGGRDFKAEQFDLATQGKRQTGSAFKPFVLAAALEQGYGLGATWDASPFSTPVKGGGEWHVENYENGITRGRYTLEMATIMSINTVYARLIMVVGPDKVVDVARRMGITTPIEPVPAIALGGLSRGVSPLEMASAFGTIANKGVSIKPSGIDRVTDSKGKPVYAPDRVGRRAISAGTAKKVAGVLNQVYTRGTGTGANFGKWGAVKTGTAQSWRDAWIVGYSGDISTAVWVGYPKSQVPMERVHGIRVTGGSFPAQVWKGFMKTAVTYPVGASRGEEADAPATPGARYRVFTLCPESLKIARPDCPEPMELLLPAGSISDEPCTLKH